MAFLKLIQSVDAYIATYIERLITNLPENPPPFACKCFSNPVIYVKIESLLNDGDHRKTQRSESVETDHLYSAVL